MELIKQTKKRWRRIMTKAFPHTVLESVSQDQAQVWLSPKRSTELLDELRDFGALLLDEAGTRTSALDDKAMATLGWAGAALGFFVIGSPDWITTNSWAVAILSLFGIICACTSALSAWLALRVRSLASFSQVDWFREAEFGDAARLRSYHLISMLNAHRARCDINAEKGDHLVAAQWSLALSIAIVGGMAIVRVVGLFFGFGS